MLRKERPRFERAGPFLSAPPFLKRIDWIVLTAWPKFESTECDEKAPAEADASHDPAEFSRLVVGESLVGFQRRRGLDWPMPNGNDPTFGRTRLLAPSNATHEVSFDPRQTI